MAKKKNPVNVAVTATQATTSVISVVIVVICILFAARLLGPNSEVSTDSTHPVSSSPQRNSSNLNSQCQDESYKTELISLDPLVIYIRDFFSTRDIDNILQVAENRFNPSVVNQNGKLIQNPYRSSSSAALPAGEPAVHCVLERSRQFLGTVLDPNEDEMGVPQLVRYTEGQEYNLHHDWMRTPQPAFDGSPRSFNRVVSFLVILQDGCIGGETWFPFIKAVSPQPTDEKEGRLWREHEDGGIAFKPVAGNALFWVNLFPNGTGDTRTVHAGLPVTGGLKTAMNIWPRQYRSNL
ncbi:hypothetical protein F5Y03DRAFT_71364 [Xylaria venustula]|nr:hypothetical protein F5Y03DRAFT_71364 [Xylaria venustula]